ncbi:hypothetical protein AMEX_G7538 [Astyanax mexicanus]|uniref:Galectin n=1 Tax=Astyanax mexicanus TaxID=7994 RepID=A0A8T2LYY1_ASTMX|nr:hypothetical protein AMEX_G7538 [Astyanax mexicanus]
MDPWWRSRPLPTVAQSGDFSFRTRPVSPWQGEEPPPCQPGSLEMQRRAHIKMWIEGQREGLLPISHPVFIAFNNTCKVWLQDSGGDCGGRTLEQAGHYWSSCTSSSALKAFHRCEEARIASLTITHHPKTFSQSDGPMLVAEADPSYRLDTTGPVPRIIPGPAAQAVADLEDDSEEEEFLEQAPIAQWEEAEVASLTATFHTETSSQSGVDVLVLDAEADPSHRLDTNSTEPESEPVPVAQAEGDLESSVEVMVESIETAPKNKRGWLQRCLRLWRSTASTFLSCCPYRALTVTDLRFYAGQKFTVSGKVKSGCENFSINIEHDVNNIALHFNPRFKYNKDRNVIVCNSNRGGWGSEQKEKVFPFQRDGDFRVAFNFKNDQFYIRLPDGNVFSFPNRFGDDRFIHLHVEGDVKIHSFKVI